MVKLIKEIYCFIKKNYGYKPALFVLLSIILIIISFRLGRSDLFRDNKASVSSNFQSMIISDDTRLASDSNNSGLSFCEEGRFEDNIDKWIIKYYDKPDEDGFYCPRSKKFFSPDIWYKDLIPTIFKSLVIRYKIKNKDDSIEIPPLFIFSIGESPRILRFYIAENNPEIIGFEKIVIVESDTFLKREEIKLLDYPIEYNGEVELNVRIMINEGNKVTFYFNLNYISAVHNRSVKNGFSYEVDLPDPNPDSEHSKLKIGFGTIKGSCIKPISYKFCY